ncbi:hypothetical protein D3C75_971980 [compost metagenome]
MHMVDRSGSIACRYPIHPADTGNEMGPELLPHPMLRGKIVVHDPLRDQSKRALRTLQQLNAGVIHNPFSRKGVHNQPILGSLRTVTGVAVRFAIVI